MKKRLFLLTLLSIAFALPASAADRPEKNMDSRCFEMRTYYAAEGKLDDLHARFRDHTLKIFEKHGIQNIGYWVPIDNPERKLIYVLAYPNREAREKSWKEFFADPDWKKAASESEAHGKLVAKVETAFMQATDYSPEIKPYAPGTSRVFELRTYTAAEGKLDDLNARFRDHTLALFKKYGMENIAYWNISKGEKDADHTLIYMLAHKSKDAAKESFDAFRKDSDWVKAKSDSEKNGPLTVQDGVKSVFLTATDYSPTK